MTTVSPTRYFSQTEPVWLMTVSGVPRLGSGSDSIPLRFRDGMLLPATGFPGRVRRLVLSVLLASGVVHRARGTASESANALVAGIVQASEGCSRVVALAGTPGPAAKATLVLLDSDSAPVAYAKVGESDIARALVRNEIEVLQGIRDGIGPELLGHGESAEATWLLARALRGRPVRAAARIPDQFLDSSRRPDGVALTDHPVLDSIPSSDSGLVALAAAAVGSRRFAVTYTHGDAAPWNAVVGADGIIRLFDWEYGRLDGLPETDAAHWSLQTSRLIGKMSPSRAVQRAVVALALRGAMDDSEAAAVCVITSLLVAARHDIEGNAESSSWWHDAARAAASIVDGRRTV